MDIKKFIEWAKTGDRNVTIEITRQGEIKVWCFDYDLMAGDLVAINDDPPSKEEIMESQRDLLNKQIERLAKKHMENA